MGLIDSPVERGVSFVVLEFPADFRMMIHGPYFTEFMEDADKHPMHAGTQSCFGYVLFAEYFII